MVEQEVEEGQAVLPELRPSLLPRRQALAVELVFILLVAGLSHGLLLAQDKVMRDK
jgi:hypothetical protein